MNKNERRQFYQKNKNTNEISNILKDLNINYSKYNNIYINNLINLTSFFENLSLILESIPSKIIFPKIDNTLYNDNNSSINIINNFYNYHKNIIKNLCKISININQNIIPKLKDYKNNLENENTDISFFIEDIIKRIDSNQQKINESNDNYKNESEKLTKLELDSIKKLNNTAMLGLIHKTLDDQRKKVTNYSLIQQQEIQKLNKFYSEAQEETAKKIFQIKSHFKNNNYIIFESIKEFLTIWDNNITDNNKNESKKLLDKINNVEENLKPDAFIDSILLNNKNKTFFYNKWKYSINNESENNNNDDKKDDNNVSHILKTPKLPFTDIKYDPEYMYIIKDVDLNNNQNQINNNSIKNTEQVKQTEFLYSFFQSLRKNKEILNTELSEVVNLLEQKAGKMTFYQDFCDQYLSSNNSQTYSIYSLFEFTNFTNLAHLKTFLNNILENISVNLKDKKADSFCLLDKIIIIGEKTLYDKTYLCSLLNKNKIFSNKSIWEDCIKFKIIDLLNEICEHYTINNSMINDGINKLYNQGTKLIGNFLGFEQKKITKKENIIEYLGLIKNLPKYNILSEDKKIILNKNHAPYIIQEVFKIYIRHMSNYGYSLEDSINIIYHIYNYYQFNDNNIINYYLTYNNIFSYSIKNKKEKYDVIHKSEKIKEKIKDIKNKKYNNIKYQINIKNEKNKIIILKKIFVFLDNKEKIKLLFLSKKIKNVISNKIYKNILKQKYTSVEAHIQIWKILLHFKQLKKDNKGIYNNYKKEIEKLEIKQKYQKSFKVIDVDISRTEFLKNKQKGKIAINNILKSLQLYSSDNSYCQGMNYMAAFLYENILNEEDSFFIILSLFLNKKFSLLFKNEMAQLKNYFIITDRLIHLYLPKIYSHFKKNQIIPDFFLSPYFITLFTQIYPAIKEKNNIFVLRVWDEFIMNGWKSLFEAILTLLKLKEKNILMCEGDQLVDLLVNKIDKDKIFLNRNYEQFEQMKKYFIIPNELLKNLEEEIFLENKIKK